jgi:hypothetical protein
MLIVLIWILFGIAAAAVASGKQRSGLGWFFLGVLFGPFALFVIAFLPTIGISSEESMSSADLRVCPFCAEKIKSAAIVCKHCGRDVEPIPTSSAVAHSGPITASLARHTD